MNKSGKQNSIFIGCLCAVVCETMYGLSYLFTRQATQKTTELPLLGWRFLVAFLALSILAATGLVRIRLKGKSVKPLLKDAMRTPVYYIAETVGIRHTTASESGVILACIPAVSLIASSVLLKKKPTKLQVTGILITLCGVVLTVIAAGVSSSFSALGYACLLAAVALYSLYCVYVDRAKGYTGFEITYMMLAAGAAVFVTLALAEALANGDLRTLAVLPFRDTDVLAAVLFQGLGSVLAFFLANVAIAKIGVNRTASFVGISTVVAVIAGVLVLHEKLTALLLIGAIVIIAGVYTANAGRKEESEG